jgi:hypothetical protein
VAAGAGSDGGVSGPVTLAARSRANVDIIGSTFTAHWKLGPVIMSQNLRVSTSCGEAGDGPRADMFDVIGEPGCEELSEVVALMDAPPEPGWVVGDDGDGFGGPGRPAGWVLFQV